MIEWVKKDIDFLYLDEKIVSVEEISSLIEDSITLDSSTIIYDYTCFDKFKNTKLIIPSVVIEELNVLKEESNTERGQVARKVLGFFSALIKKHGHGLKDGIVYNGNIIKVHYIGKLAKDSPLNYLRTIEEDELIIETARVTETKLCTRDNEMSIIASDFVTLYEYKFDVIEKEIYKGYRYVPISLEDYENPSSIYQKIYLNKKIVGNPLNMFPWEFALFVDEGEYSKLLEIKNSVNSFEKEKSRLRIIHTAVFKPDNTKTNKGNLISIDLDKYTNGYKVNALNQEQKMFMYLLSQLEQKNIHLLSVQGGAGRGKTVQAVDFGLKTAVFDNQYTKMLYTKSIREIDKSEELGTVPGDEFEKYKNYVLPFYSAIEYIHRRDIYGDDIDEKSKGKNEIKSQRSQNNKENGVTSKNQKQLNRNKKTSDEIVEEYRASNRLVFLPIGKIRGMNIYNSFGILDEAQNTTRHGMKTYISRFDNTSSGLILGDNNQIDDPHLTKQNNGFSHLIENGKEVPYIAHITLDINKDAVRGLLATFASSNL